MVLKYGKINRCELLSSNFSSGEQIAPMSRGASLCVSAELGRFCNKHLFHTSYVLLDEINEGAFGKVYYTHHVSNDEEKFAVKIIDNMEIRDGIIHEAKIICLLRDVPNVIELHDFFMDSESIYIVQDLALGGDVFDRLAKKKMYTERDARELAKLLLVTIGHVHERKVVHRDLKPENLLLQSEDDNSKIMLCDFGCAKILPEDESSRFFSLVGTPAYVAPEIFSHGGYREQVDLWSVGCIIFILLGGHPPFGHSDDADIYDRIERGDYDFNNEAWDIVSGSAKRLIKKLLEKDPKERWGVSEALESRWFKKDVSYLQKKKLNGSLDGIKMYVSTKAIAREKNIRMNTKC